MLLLRGLVAHRLSTLALLVARVGADHEQLAVAADQLAVLADPLDARSNLHRPPRGQSLTLKISQTTIVAIRVIATRDNLFYFEGDGRQDVFVLGRTGRYNGISGVRRLFLPPRTSAMTAFFALSVIALLHIGTSMPAQDAKP